MANWKYKLKLVDLKDEFEADKIPLDELCKKIASRIEELPCYKIDTTLQEIVMQFEDEIADTNDFDNILEQLYDWGDEEVKPYGKWPANKQCWIGFAF